MMMYGTRDGDLSGYAGNTGFRVVDRAVRPRHMVTIHGGNHNFFNSTWASDGAPTISRSQQETLARAFVTPFFSHYLLDQQAYVEMLAGYVVPPSVSAAGTTIAASLASAWRALIAGSGRLLPRTTAQWGLFAVASSFVLLALGALASMFRPRPPESSGQ
jgi:hypothetical protein